MQINHETARAAQEHSQSWNDSIISDSACHFQGGGRSGEEPWDKLVLNP